MYLALGKYRIGISQCSDDIWRDKQNAELKMEGQYQDGMEKGRAEGEAKGRAEERFANAKNLLANGVPMDVIVKSLGLTPEEINVLSKK